MKTLLACIASLLVLSAFAIGDEAGDVTIDIVPPNPMASEEVTLSLHGTWPDTCVPSGHQLLHLGSFIAVNLVTPGEGCDPQPNPWQMDISLGELSAGTYFVTVSHEGDTIGQRSFTVGEEAPPWVEPVEPAMCENPYFPPLILLSATVEEIPWGASLPVAMIVTVTAYEQSFLFNSGQRYDFTIYRDGEEVWRWSADQAFTMAIGEETYGMDAVLYFERVDTGELPGPGTYTLRGTLTTEGMVEDDGLIPRGPAHFCVTFEVVE